MNLFNIRNPDNHEYPVIVSISHSGTFVPTDISSDMLPSVVLSNVDWFLKEPYDFLPDMGITVISSNISRYVIDLNRDKTEDISLSNYNNQSSSVQSIEALRDILAEQGYKMGVNVIRGRYILKSYYGEEELNSWNTALFIGANAKLQAEFTKLFNEMEGKNEF